MKNHLSSEKQGIKYGMPHTEKTYILKRIVFLFSLCLSSLSCYTQVITNPLFDRTALEVLHPHVDKIELKKDSTKIYCSINIQESFSYSIPKTMFIKDIVNNKKYQITNCIGLPFEPEERLFDHGGTYHFVFCFPHIKHLHKFNLIEDLSQDRLFNIYGINASTTYPKTYEETEYKRFKNMSNFYESSGDYIRYSEYKEKELYAAQYIYGTKSIAASECYNRLAHNYNEQGNYIRAIDFGTLALECDSIYFGIENKEYPIYVNTLGSLSLFYRNAGKTTESYECLKKSIRIRRNIGDDQGFLNELSNLLHCEQYIKEETIKRVDYVLKELETLPNTIDIASMAISKIYKEIASAFSAIDDNKNAIDYCNKALHIVSINNGKNNEEYAGLLGLKCRYQQRNGQAKDAITSGIAAIKLYDSLNIKSLVYAELHEDLSRAYWKTLNYEESIQLQETAAKIYETSKNWLSLAGIYAEVSQNYYDSFNNKKAEEFIKKAISVLNEHSNAEDYIKEEVENTGNRIINNPSTLFSINQLISMLKSRYYHTLSRIYFDRGDIANAINSEITSRKIIKDMEDTESYALHLMVLSQYYLKNKQQDEAITCAEKSVQTLSETSIDATLLNLNLAIVYYQSGDTLKAIKYTEKTLATLESNNDINDIINTLWVLAFLHYQNHNYKKAEQYLSSELDYCKNILTNELIEMTREQKQRLWDKYESHFLLYRLIIENSNKDGALISKLYDYILFSKSLLLDSDIQNDDNRMNVTWKNIQQKLSDDDIAIEFMSNYAKDDYITYHALIIDKNCLHPKMITLCNEKDLEKTKNTNNKSIRDTIGNMIWKPIMAQYNNVKNIYFSPDGILHILPIEYYNVNSTTNMFAEYNMYRLSSTKELVNEHIHEQFNRAVLYGGLDYVQLKETETAIRTSTREIFNIWRGIIKRGGFDPLFSTLEETQKIEELLSSKNITTMLYTGEEGTEESIRNLSNQKLDIIHLATHGMYVGPEEVVTKKQNDNFDFLESISNDNNPVKEDASLTHSFLVMSGGNRLIQRDSILGGDDGILTAFEISQMKFMGLDLVVLSACDTAKGDLENGGVYGLQRGFKKAGAKTILMSLDKVDDEATKILMIEFYRNLMDGKNKLQSLINAQKHLRSVDNGKYDDPKYWGAFIMLDGLN